MSVNVKSIDVINLLWEILTAAAGVKNLTSTIPPIYLQSILRLFKDTDVLLVEI